MSRPAVFLGSDDVTKYVAVSVMTSRVGAALRGNYIRQTANGGGRRTGQKLVQFVPLVRFNPAA